MKTYDLISENGKKGQKGTSVLCPQYLDDEMYLRKKA